MSKEQLAGILELGAQNPPPENATPPEFRAWFEAVMAPLPTAEGIAISQRILGGISAEQLQPAGGDPARLILYIHGGGWLFGSSRSHRVITSNLAALSGSTVLAPDYRLAPEHPAPAAHEDAFACYQWALEQGYDSAKIVLAGESAGANMALATALRARDAGLPLPAALLLYSPYLDLAGEGRSHQEVSDDPVLNTAMLELFVQAYIGAGNRKSPQVTPLYGDLTGLPPTLVHVGGWEMLRDDSVTLVERMKAAGVDASVQVFDGMVHVWQAYAPFLDEGMASLEQGARFIQIHQV